MAREFQFVEGNRFLEAHIREALASSTRQTIAIVGGSASGKDFLSERLANAALTYHVQDGYFLGGIPGPEGITNHDHPSSLDLDLYGGHFLDLSAGRDIMAPEYCFKQGKRTGYVPVQAKFVTLTQGLFVAHREEWRDVIDLLVFVDAPEAVRKERRLVRDVTRAGRSRDK